MTYFATRAIASIDHSFNVSSFSVVHFRKATIIPATCRPCRNGYQVYDHHRWNFCVLFSHHLHFSHSYAIWCISFGFCRICWNDCGIQIESCVVKSHCLSIASNDQLGQWYIYMIHPSVPVSREKRMSVTNNEVTSTNMTNDKIVYRVKRWIVKRSIQLCLWRRHACINGERLEGFWLVFCG